MLRYRIDLENRRLAPGTVNLCLGAVLRLACEASDCRILARFGYWHPTSEGRKEDRRGLRDWLTAEQSQRLWRDPGSDLLKEKRDRARCRF